MPAFEQDFLLRQIRMLAQAITEIVRKAHLDGSYAAGIDALRRAAGEGDEARRLTDRAAALYAECALRFPGEAPACEAAARALGEPHEPRG